MSLREETRKLKSRLKTEMKNMFRRDEAPSTSTPNPGQAASLGVEKVPSHLSLAPAELLPNSGSYIASWANLEGWANLKGCLDTLDQAASTAGFGPLKAVIEGIAECTGVYEDAAQGRQAYIELRTELEDIFQELHQYLALSPIVAANVSDVCGSIQKEIDYVKSQQVRPRIRRLAEAKQDEENVLACYKRMRHHLQGLSRKMGISTLTIVEQNAMDDRLEKLAPASSARYNSGNALTLKRGPCTEGTRMKILEYMHQWVASRDTGNIYWISGMAGTGK